MTDPVTGAAGAGIVKAAGLFAGAATACAVVMAMTRPKAAREWFVALLSTFMSSACGGAALVQWYGLRAWSDTFEGSVALAGLYFTAGLPAWVLVRAAFVWSERRSGQGLPELLRDLRKGWTDGQ